MSKATRQDIIKSIGAGIEYDILKEGQIKPGNSLQFKALVEHKATAMLEKYEGAMRPRFWYGVWQGVTGNFIWLIIMAVLAFILAIFSLNIWELMIDSIAAKLKAMP